ncbi:MAG: AAA family ATPase [Patescibacteria group bacterium]
MLKRLEIFGFKSFVKKTPLEFSQKITAIVGPNGSGKSNIAEAIRFVLGEQSMKSLRGKSGTDLIFKGSKNLSALSRANVAIVFDNKKRSFGKHETGESGINLDFDEIIISREVYGDGTNHYIVNDSQVRLKDILEILAPLNIGSSGHHIISQGEADKILNASIKERKEMIEDALGLRVYQYKILESERKLGKTNENIKEAESLRRELAPHIIFLKKQVEKIEKAREMREELKGLYLEYFKREDARLKSEKENLKQAISLRKELGALEEKLSSLKRELSLSPESVASEREARESDTLLQQIRNKKEELSRRVGRLEGIIELEDERAKEIRGQGSFALVTISFSEVKSFGDKLLSLAEEALKKRDRDFFEQALSEIKSLVSRFIAEKEEEGSATQKEEKILNKITELKKERAGAGEELVALNREEEKIVLKMAQSKRALEEAKETLRDKERSFFELSSKRSELASQVGIFGIQEEKFRSEEEDFKREMGEALALVGEEVNKYQTHALGEEGEGGQETRRKKIERIKIRLEDAGVGGGEDVLKEYETTRARDKFLEDELSDLKQSKGSLEALMTDLKEKLNAEFKDGISKINVQFGEFFKSMFGGGTAHLSLVKREKRRYGMEEEDELFDDKEKEFEEGIEINVSLPQKKIKDLAMLSGGERALTSIALLFAISQVNPPPFLVLDETDAMLDEANSRKYGDMLQNLSKFSNLIVITHNRETMSRANVLYGITMGADGVSRILSVKFDEATAYAK